MEVFLSFLASQFIRTYLKFRQWFSNLYLAVETFIK